MAPYLTASEIATRLTQRFNIITTVSTGDADLASDALDAKAPFHGEKYSATQTRQFPRTYLKDGDTAGVVPNAVLDYVVLYACVLANDEAPGITSESVLDQSVSYSAPKLGKARTYLKSASITMKGYQKSYGQFGSRPLLRG